MENVYFTVGHRQEEHLKSTGLEKPRNLCLHLVLRLPAAEVGVDVSIEVTLGSPCPHPGMFWLPFPPAEDKGRQAGWHLSCSGRVQSIVTLLHPLAPDSSPLPCPQGHSHGSSSRTPWSPHLAGGYHGFSCPAPAGHSGLLLILQGSSQMSVFRAWGPWVPAQTG